MTGLVHFADPTDHRTACGKFALMDDGTTRRLEVDTRDEQVTCKPCCRALAKARGESA